MKSSNLGNQMVNGTTIFQDGKMHNIEIKVIEKTFYCKKELYIDGILMCSLDCDEKPDSNFYVMSLDKNTLTFLVGEQ